MEQDAGGFSPASITPATTPTFSLSKVGLLIKKFNIHIKPVLKYLPRH